MLTLDLDDLLALSDTEKVLINKLTHDGSALNHTTFVHQKDQFLSAESSCDNYLKTVEYFARTKTTIIITIIIIKTFILIYYVGK